MTITTGIIAYAIASVPFLAFILLLFKGGNSQDEDGGAPEGAYPVDRFNKEHSNVE